MSKIESEAAVIQYIDDVVHVIYHEQAFFGIEEAKSVSKDRIGFCGGSTYPHLFDIRKVRKMSKEARDFIAQDNELISVSAMLVSSSVVKMIANFFVQVNPPKIRTKAFTDKNQACRWLWHFQDPPFLP